MTSHVIGLCIFMTSVITSAVAPQGAYLDSTSRASQSIRSLQQARACARHQDCHGFYLESSVSISCKHVTYINVSINYTDVTKVICCIITFITLQI